jgi:hypothetical protein
MRIRTVLLAGLVALNPACLTPVALYCDEAKPCTDPARPFCDLNGQYPASEFIGHTCIPDPFPDAGCSDCACTPGDVIDCRGTVATFCDRGEPIEIDCPGGCDGTARTCGCDADVCGDGRLLSCGPGGVVERVTDCRHGCSPDAPRCQELDPSNGLSPQLDQAAGAPVVTLADGAIINTDTGEILDGTGQPVVVPSTLLDATGDGPAVRVFMSDELTISATTCVGGPALAIVANRALTVRGRLRLDCGRKGTGNCTGQMSEDGANGGVGGAGFGAIGGGGGAGGGQRGGTRGLVSGTTTLEPLLGGCSSGNHVLAPPTPGGGAVQLVSRERVILEGGGTRGMIDANGKGGQPVPFGLRYILGGGSGGGILIEAPIIDVGDGAGLFANGGGGACSAAPGSDGLLSESPAPGGSCSAADLGSGGAGGARNVAAAGGEPGSARGGGGGGVGRIRLNVGTNGLILRNGSLLSPAPSLGPIRLR